MPPRPSARNVLAAVAVFMALWFVGTRPDSPQTPTPSPSSAPSADLHRAPIPQLDPASLPADTVWTFTDNGAESTYAIALNELYVPSGTASTRLHSIAPQKNLPALLAAATTLGSQTGVQPRLVLYPLDGPRDESSRRIVTQQVHIQTENLDAVRAATRSLGVINWTTPDYAPGHAIAQVEGDPAQALRVADALSRLANVISATPLLAVQHAKLADPVSDDEFFPQQWHLEGNTDGDYGINVTPVWPTHKGTGINIGIIDDGVQITHPDLVDNAAASGHYDWNDDDTDPSPSLSADDHGTAVAGLAAARGNNTIGVSGVAPEATLYGLRLISQATTDQEDAEAMAWKNDVIDIKNNSWGPSSGPTVLGTSGSLWQSAVANGTSLGRRGLGTIYVFSSGNGRASGKQGNKNGYANNIHVIAVGATTGGGDSASFSEGGSHLVVSAPGQSTPGIVTTDRTGSNGYNPGSSDLSDTDYTQTFSGTSASAPIVSGVIALMLEANPDLGWRDVKEILLRSSKQLQPNDGNWVTRDDGMPSHPIKHHELFGGGLIDADAAVTLAASWTPLGTETVVTKSTERVSQTIPDDSETPLVIPITPSGPRLRVEHVEVTVNIKHSWRGDLEIKLTSPSGTVSTLASPTNDSGDNYPNWTFTSVRHWGEISEGTWQLSIRDDVGIDIGTFSFATIKFHGVALDAPVITLHPEDTVAALGANVTLTSAAVDPALSALTYQWSRNGIPIPGKTQATLTLNGITAAQVGIYTCTFTNEGLITSTTKPAQVSVYDAVDQAVGINNGTNFVSPTVTAGAFDSFQWYYEGSPLADSSRVTGSATSKLTITGITPADDGAYTLKAVLDDTTVTTGALNLSVRPPPDVTAPASQSIRLGATPALALATTGGPYTYAYTGLPKGVSYNPATGALSGRPTTAGTYTVFLAVTDGFSNSTTRTITLTVEPLPAALVGTFNGIVARDPSLNANLGGALNLVTTSSGAFTGKLTLGTSSYSFKGQLDGAAGGPATVTVNIPTKGLLQLSIPTDNTTVTGTLNSTAVTAWRNPWGKTAAASAYATKYVFALEAPLEGDGSVWPAGYSTGSVTVTTAGAASWTLLPADGTAALKGTTTIAADGSMPLFAPVKTPVGSFVGTLKLPPLPPPSTPADPITGSLSWLRRSTSSTLYANAAGFGPVALTPLGGRYSAPPSGTLLLGLPSGSNNANLEFDDLDLGALSSALSPFTFTVAAGNKIVLPASNPTALKLTATASTGLFTGTFVLADPNPLNTSVIVKRTSKFSGVFLPNEDFGAGFFILPALPGSGTGTRSGAVIFTEND